MPLASPVFAASAEQPLLSASRVTTIVKADEKSGHLVRSYTVQPRPVIAKETTVSADISADIPVASGDDLSNLVDRIAAEQGVEDSLVHSVIRAESNYNPGAVSPKGAFGLMQLIPATAKRFGVSNVFDPADNVQGGVKYLKFLLEYYRGDYPKAIAAYNAGEGAVDKYNGVPPYPETRNYVVQVAKNLKTARLKRATAPVKPEPVRTADASIPETSVPPPASTGTDGRVYYRTP